MTVPHSRRCSLRGRASSSTRRWDASCSLAACPRSFGTRRRPHTSLATQKHCCWMLVKMIFVTTCADDLWAILCQIEITSRPHRRNGIMSILSTAINWRFLQFWRILIILITIILRLKGLRKIDQWSGASMYVDAKSSSCIYVWDIQAKPTNLILFRSESCKAIIH